MACAKKKKKKKKKSFCIFHWNLKSIAAHGFAESLLLKAYISVHKMDIICLSETYFGSTIQLDNNNL